MSAVDEGQPQVAPRTQENAFRWPRTLTAICAALCLLQVIVWEPVLVAPSAVMLMALAVILSVVRRSRTTHALPLGHWMIVACSTGGACLLVARSEVLASVIPLQVLAGVMAAGATLTASLARGRAALLGFVAIMAIVTGILLGDLATVEVLIDVQPFLEDGIDAALAGQSPYGITIPNFYNEVDSARFYGPGVVQDGRVVFGYPYLPVPLMLDVPMHLLGDVRWMHLAAMLVAGIIGWRLASDGMGRSAAVLLVVNPLTTTVLVAYWVEPVLVGLLALTTLGMLRGHRWTGVALGLFFASKQYAVSFVPSLWSVGRSSGWRTVWLAAAIGVAVVGAFFLWDPSAFVGSTIEFHLAQPFRHDSMSLLPGLDDLMGPLPEWALAAAPLVGLAVSLVVAMRTRPGATAFTLGVGLSLLVTVLLSKQGHANYFYIVGAALLFATITWPEDDPIPQPEDQTRDPSSQGSRGVRDIVATR